MKQRIERTQGQTFKNRWRKEGRGGGGTPREREREIMPIMPDQMDKPEAFQMHPGRGGWLVGAQNKTHRETQNGGKKIQIQENKAKNELL